MTKDGHCEQHRPRDDRARWDERYGIHWPKIRARKLRATPLCEGCRMKGVATEAREVHHKDHDTLNHEDSNLESLCCDCHDREHGKNK